LFQRLFTPSKLFASPFDPRFEFVAADDAVAIGVDQTVHHAMGLLDLFHEAGVFGGGIVRGIQTSLILFP
jgi:hypothetical protein